MAGKCVAVGANAGSQLSDFSHELLAGHPVQILVHAFCTLAS
jgi:hypothetical protein